MALDPGTMGEAVGGAISFLGAVWGVFRHISHKAASTREKHKEEILGLANAEIAKVKESLEVKIKTLEVELESQRISVSKDFQNFKETHNAEVKALGEKIENLRQDLQAQHQALVGLLTKLVDR